ncbi:MAG TPA: NAD(P)-dependent alcohol dehydrogenase [Chloroflexota bacterium]|jgi:NADPH:quinone reductase-like Zn-dependent oxidoreductase|nr:NAD(P)-dependent alcohol dehydrogenase [Chloroflexota bacterium]
MRALIRERYGPPDVLEVREVERPAPKEGEVLVRVHAASINDWDWGLLNRPTLPFSRGAPQVRILGSDVAGRVAAAGSGVRRLRVGDEVHGDLSRFGSGGWGGFAEYVCAPERALIVKPPGMTFEQAAALPQAGQLAVQGLFAAGPLRAGRTILINGAGGGVGTIAVQLAKLHDVEVAGVDRASKHGMMRGIGFDDVIDYEKEDFTESGRRYDLILDTKTNRPPSAYARALHPGGTYATVGGENRRLLQVAAFGWLARLTAGRTVRLVILKQNRDLPYLNERFEAGQLVPVIDGPYDLSDAREAFRHFGAGSHKGKVVITMA